MTNIQSTVRLFADDCLIYQSINSPNVQQLLQQDLNTLGKWAATWQMEFNVNKCCILQLSKHHNKAIFPYQMSNKLFKVVEQHCYLGIIIDHLFCGSQNNHACMQKSSQTNRFFTTIDS